MTTKKSKPKATLGSTDPQRVDSNTLYWEEKRGILVVREVHRYGTHLTTEEFYIPWGTLRASLKRKDASK